ncbi:MAG: SpoIIIAH-like family protein [Bacillaceae bacterium]|nr:SpoIIIAH-like family protein [Bacillaceae bacterium]
MILKKQTVWLLSMLTIMVVLSAYYMVQGPVEQVPVVTEDQQSEEGQASEINVQTDELSMDRMEGLETSDSDSEVAVPNQSGSDYFIAYRMERDAWQSKQMEELMSVMSDTSASSEEIAEAKEEYEELASLKDAETTVEELIKANGYQDAIVVARDDRVNVIVQAEQLDESQVVEIIGMVTQHFDVPGNNVVVSYKE